MPDMTRLQQFQQEVRDAQSRCLRAKMPEGKMLDAALCNDIPNQFFTYTWAFFKMAAGSIPLNAWVKNNGFEKCKKAEATCLLMVGETNECGDFLRGKHKSLWLKPINE